MADTAAAICRRFYFSFAITCAALVGAVSAFVVWANPWQSYGNSGYFTVYNDRYTRSLHLASLPSAEAPQAFVLGSSIMYPFLPANVDAAFGVRSYSLASFFGRIEDSWCWLEFVTRSLGWRPRLLVLGIEPSSFADATDGPVLLPYAQRRLLNAPLLATYFPGGSPRRIAGSKAIDLLSAQQLKLGIVGALGARPRETLPSAGDRAGIEAFIRAASYRLDGSGPYGDERNYSPFDPGTKLTLRNVRDYLPASRLRESGLVLLERLVHRAREVDAEVVLIFPPLYAPFAAMLREQAGYASLLEAVRGRVDLLARQHPGRVTVLDAASRDLGADAYIDQVHLKPSAAHKLLNEAAAKRGAKQR